MTSRLGWQSRWKSLREHPAFQAALIFAGAAWLVLQVADVLGLPLGLVRVLGAILVFVFAGLLLYAIVVTRGARPDGATPWRRRSRVLLATAVGLLVLGTVAWWVRSRVVSGAVKPGAGVIAILPFSASGSSVDLLGEGMVDLLSKDLDGVGGIRVVDPRTTLYQWRSRGGKDGLDLNASLDVGRALQAGSILTGGVVAVGNEVRINADLIGVDGHRLATSVVNGSADSVLLTVDRLSTDLLRQIWRTREPIPSLRLDAITTPVTAALRAYLRGEQYYRRSQWDSASAAFEEAVREDSTFALAHFRLGMSSGWMEFMGSPASQEHGAAAVRFADRLPPRERTLMVAQALHEAGNVAALDTIEQYVRRYPDDADGWQCLADVQFHSSLLLGDSLGAAIPAFDHAISLDPSAAPAYIHPLDAAAVDGDSARFDHYLAGLAASASPASAELYRTIRKLRWSPDSERLSTFAAAYRSSVGRSHGEEQQLIGMAELGAEHAAAPDADMLLAIMDTTVAVDLGATQYAAIGRAVGRFRADLGMGRLRATRAELDTVIRLNRNAAVRTLPMVLAGLVSPAVGEPVLNLLEDPPQQATTVYWRTVAALAEGDTVTARSLLDMPLAADSAIHPAVPNPFFHALRAWTRVEAGDTAAGLPELQKSLIASGYTLGAMMVQWPALIALARTEATRPESRAKAINRMKQLLDLWGLDLVALNEPYAEALEAEGRTGEAAEAYNRFIMLWTGADPELQPRVEAARQALSRITAERSGS